MPVATRRRLLGGGLGVAAGGLAGNAAATTVDVQLEARATILEVARRPVELLTYNGQFP
jgi:hypothetical protein